MLEAEFKIGAQKLGVGVDDVVSIHVHGVPQRQGSEEYTGLLPSDDARSCRAWDVVHRRFADHRMA